MDAYLISGLTLAPLSIFLLLLTASISVASGYEASTRNR